MSIPLGFASTGMGWSAAAQHYNFPIIVSQVLIGLSIIGWLAILIARLPVTTTRYREFRHAFQDPISGPFPAYVPIVGLILTSYFIPVLPEWTAQASCLFWSLMLTLMCGYIVSIWISGSLDLHHIHPGYSLPVIAGPFIASSCLTATGFHTLGVAAAGAGVFFWLVIGTIIFTRLIVAAPLHPAMSPTLSVIVTPPVTAGSAWFLIRDGRIDTVQLFLLGIIALLVTTQIFLAPRYLRIPFSRAHWAIQFPIAALTGYSIKWDVATNTTTSLVFSLALLTLSSASLLILCTTALKPTFYRVFRTKTHDKSKIVLDSDLLINGSASEKS